MEKEKLEKLIDWLDKLCVEKDSQGRKTLSDISANARPELKKAYDCSVRKMTGVENVLKSCLIKKALPCEIEYANFFCEKMHEVNAMSNKQLNVVDVAKIFKEFCKIDYVETGDPTYLHVFENAYQEKDWIELEKYNKEKH